jgi:hypothetical protein
VLRLRLLGGRGHPREVSCGRLRAAWWLLGPVRALGVGQVLGLLLEVVQVLLAVVAVALDQEAGQLQLGHHRAAVDFGDLE